VSADFCRPATTKVGVMGTARAAAATLLLVSLTLGGCSWFGSGHKDGTTSESVFSVHPSDCFVAPTKVKAELSDLSKVPCTKAHTLEAYAAIDYQATGTGASAPPASGDAYPGSGALTTFAQGRCAQSFAGYVGVNYLDSSLYFTFLLPSARSWEQDNDRKVLCFVTTTGGTLTSSVKGSKK
jgi:Septum formation